MTQQYDNTLRGSIWPNHKKQTANHPDFTGSYTDENGKEFWVSAWKKKDGANDKAPVLSFSMKPKDAAPVAQQSNNSVTIDSCPF